MSHEIMQPSTHENPEPRAALLDHPDIRSQYDQCLETDFPNETAYLQGLLAFVHACDLAYQDEKAGHNWGTVKDVSLHLIDLHLQTGHYAFCHGELDFLLNHYADYESGQLPEDVEESLKRVSAELKGNFAEFYEECPVSASVLTH